MSITVNFFFQSGNVERKAMVKGLDWIGRNIHVKNLCVCVRVCGFPRQSTRGVSLPASPLAMT